SQPDSLISGLDRQFEAYIAGPIQRSHTITPLVIIIDALDECSHDDDDHRAQLLEIIAREGPKLPSNRALDSIEYIDQPTFAHEFRIVVGTLIVSRNPLSITTISQLIGDELGGRDIRGVLETMQSVLREIGSDSVPIRLLHSSFSDYLTDRTLCTDELRLIDRPTHHALMAQRCLRLMNSTLKRNICNLPDNLLFDEIDDLSSSVTTNIPPELRYACRYWVDHVTRSEGQENLLVDLSSKFLHAHSLEWLEVMSLIQETDDVADILQGLLRWARLQDKADVERTLVKYLAELRHLFHEFGSIISSAGHHIYTSALPFIPSGSLLQPLLTTYHDIPKLSIGRDKTWPPLEILRGHTKVVNAIAFSPDGTRFTSASSDKTLCIWDARTHEPIRRGIKGHEDEVSCLAYS
ncbi:hypothetical protein SISSUDRAFT_957629, partial [Sistotremastrum suecicum HHB10207 ss-3]